MPARPVQMLLPSLLIALCACDPEPVYEPTCEDELTAPTGDADPLLGEDGASFEASGEAALAEGEAWSMSPRSAVTSDGATWISWYSFEASGVVFRLQRLDASGAPSFGEDGLLLSEHPQAEWVMDHALIAAEDGDVIVVFADLRSGVRDLYAYRVSAEGEQRWGEDGVALSAGDEGDEGTPAAALLADGDLAVVWDHDDGRDDVSTVRAQRLSPDGELRWPDSLELPCEAGFCDEPTVAPMEGSDMVVVWIEAEEFMTDERDLRASRLDANGCPVWSELPNLDGPTQIPYYEGMELLAVPAGVYVSWTALPSNRPLAGTVQLLRDDGSLGLGEDGLRVSSATGRAQLAPSMAWDADAESLLLAWAESTAQQTFWGLRAQRIDLDGAPAWGEEGLEIEPLEHINTGAFALRSWGDRALLFYATYPNEGEGWFGSQARPGVVVLDEDGERSRALFSETASLKSKLRVSESAAAGRWTLTWTDERADEGDVYAAHVVAQ